jgi:biotin-dependent carboxylase-like uncharacterized protein
LTITVVRAAPYLTVQDFGRLNFREAGVPRCGAMDRASLGAANAVIGNEIGSAGLEWALGGGTLRFDAPSFFALSGATVDAKLAGAPISPLTATYANAGDFLEVERFSAGRFLYVAVGGGIASEQLLGSRSTYLPARFGGIGGSVIKSGQKITCGESSSKAKAGFTAPDNLRPGVASHPIRVVPGPQWALFTEEDRKLFFSGMYSVSRASDRMGYRLDGESLGAIPGLLPSEPVCEGAIQVPPNGLPIVLMADSPTVGGYPKIGVVDGSDLPRLAQLTPGEEFRFELTTVEEAQRRVRRSATALLTLRSLALEA